MQLSQLSFFVLDEADRMVERGHFKELQTIMDMLPKTGRGLSAEAEEPPQRRKRRRETPKEDAREEQEEDGEQDEENVEVYPDSDDDNAEGAEDDEQEVDETQGDNEQGDDDQDGKQEDELEDEDQEIVPEDVGMDEDFPVSVNFEAVKKRQTLVFSATLALPPGFKKKLKRGFFDDKSVSNKKEYSVASLIQKAAMRSNAAIVDLTTKDILAKKLEESVIE